MAFILTVFGLLEKFSDESRKARFSQFLMNREKSDKYLTSEYLQLFDKIFACEGFPKSILTIKFLQRSILVSLTISVFVLFYYESNNGFILLGGFHENPSTLVKLLVYSILFNVLIDCISIIETRYLMERMSRSGITNWVGAIVLDIFLTGVIFIIPTFIVLGIIYPILIGLEMQEIIGKIPHELEKLIRLIAYEATHTIPADNWVSMGVFFWSTFISTVWTVVYIATNAFSKFTLAFVNKQTAIPIDKHPYILAGIATITFIFFITLIYELFAFIY